VLREILKTVNGSFLQSGRTPSSITRPQEKISIRRADRTAAEALSYDALDRAYYSAVKQLMERTDEPLTSTAIRSGNTRSNAGAAGSSERLSVFGAPNDRRLPSGSDFYIYFIQPFDPPASMTSIWPMRCSSE